MVFVLMFFMAFVSAAGYSDCEIYGTCKEVSPITNNYYNITGSSYNATYDAFILNVSLNYSEIVFGLWDDRWNVGTFWDRTGTVLSPKTAGDDISLQFGDLVSEVNPYAGNAIRLKGTGDDVDVVLGDVSGYFSIWDVTDTAPVFSVNNQGDIITTGGAIFNENSADRSFRIESNGNEYMLFVDGGENRVGIGTASPNKRLEVLEATGEQLRLAYSTTYYMDMGYDQMIATWPVAASNILSIGIASTPSGAGQDIQFVTSNTPRMTIEAAGNVGIGITNPSHKLQVLGNITSENVFIPQYEFSHTNRTHVLASVNVWANLTFDQEDSDVAFGISHTYNDNTNHTFIIMEDGVYNMDYDFDVEDTSGGSSDVDVAGRAIYSNGTEILGSVFEADITKKGIEVELSHNFLARLNAGDVIVFQFVADNGNVVVSTHGTFGDHPESASIIINKIANI